MVDLLGRSRNVQKVIAIGSAVTSSFVRENMTFELLFLNLMFAGSLSLRSGRIRKTVIERIIIGDVILGLWSPLEINMDFELLLTERKSLKTFKR